MLGLFKTLVIILILTICTQIKLSAQTDSVKQNLMEWEAFPILNYDSDVGVGLGAKGFIYNLLNWNESFDLILYNSTKGERWYRFVFSVPDLQRRQGKRYPLALGLILDYDKWINYKYYSTIFDYFTGKTKSESQNYKREVIELSSILSKGFTKDFVAELGLKLKSVKSSDFSQSEILYDSVSSSRVSVMSIIFNFRLDTRTNYITPKSGFVLEIDNEIAVDLLNPPAQNFYRTALFVQTYLPLIKPDFILANRLILQSISDVSYLLLLPIGGNNTVRGLPQDRYLSTSTIVLNSEFRFPIWWRFGAIAGIDIGNSESTPDWIINPVVGLRFFMDNFIARFDVGFGKETTGIYFNFGHIF